MAFYVAPSLSLLYVFWAHTPLALYATVPLLAGSFAVLDAVCGTAPPSSAPESGRRDHVLPCLYIPLQMAVTLSGIVAAARPSTGATTLVGLALAAGTTAGIFGMLAAHELIHCPGRVQRATGLAMLAATTYMHFRISHIHSHHRLAATLEDPATARRGESVYRFFLRSTVGQFGAALAIERRRTCRRWLGNRVYGYMIISGVLYAAITAMFGAKAVAFFALQSFVAIFILEVFNYVVHYGLLRHGLADGRREPLTCMHSWNAPQRFTNWGLMNGGHHSDHHRRPAASYAGLRRSVGPPELPAGYAATMAMALIPPLWRAVMHPRLDALSTGDPRNLRTMWHGQIVAGSHGSPGTGDG